MTRAERRHHDARIKRRVQTYFVCDDNGASGSTVHTSDPARIGKAARTPHPCSCAGCCNKRRSPSSSVEQLTRQERRVAHDAVDISEWGEL